jgi:hypothetical protein
MSGSTGEVHNYRDFALKLSAENRLPPAAAADSLSDSRMNVDKLRCSFAPPIE